MEVNTFSIGNFVQSKRFSVLMLTFVLGLSLVGCDSGSEKNNLTNKQSSSVQPGTKDKTTNNSNITNTKSKDQNHTASRSLGNVPNPCTPNESTDVVIAHADWSPQNLQFQVVAKRMGVGKSDSDFEVLNAQLRLTNQDGSCIISQIHLGEVTRILPDKNNKIASNGSQPLALKIESLGEVDGNIKAIVAMEQTQLSNGTYLLIVYRVREVKWGLTEFYASPVTIVKQQLIVGDPVLVGRDAMQPPVYYSGFKIDKNNADPQLILTREGEGRFTKQVVLNMDDSGAFRQTKNTQNPKALSQEDVAPSKTKNNITLKECGPEGVHHALSAKTCENGSKPLVERKGSVGRASDGHFIDEYSVKCDNTPEGVKLFYVDAYHCHRQRSD